jgi:hypothetical protein
MPPRRKSDAIERHPTTGRREMQAPKIKEHLESKENEHKKPRRQDQPIVVYGNSSLPMDGICSTIAFG